MTIIRLSHISYIIINDFLLCTTLYSTLYCTDRKKKFIHATIEDNAMMILCVVRFCILFFFIIIDRCDMGVLCSCLYGVQTEKHIVLFCSIFCKKKIYYIKLLSKKSFTTSKYTSKEYYFFSIFVSFHEFYILTYLQSEKKHTRYIFQVIIFEEQIVHIVVIGFTKYKR